MSVQELAQSLDAVGDLLFGACGKTQADVILVIRIDVEAIARIESDIFLLHAFMIQLFCVDAFRKRQPGKIAALCIHIFDIGGKYLFMAALQVSHRVL